MKKLLLCSVLFLFLHSLLFSQSTEELKKIHQEMKSMRNRILELEKDNQQLKSKLKNIESRKGKIKTQKTEKSSKLKDDIEKEVDDLIGEDESTKKSSEQKESSIFSYPISSGTSLQLLDISVDTLMTVGTSTEPNDTIKQLQLGGHDPNKIGFTLQQMELSISGAVDPYVRGNVNAVFFINDDGETIVELEEAYLISQSLPYGFQIKAGQFLTEFGRQNPSHPHSWAFVDQAVILSRFFGPDGLRNLGARISWLSPLPWHSEFFASMQNASGETAVSFLSKSEEHDHEGEDHGHDHGFLNEFAGHPFIERDITSLNDFMYMLRWANTFSLSESITMQAGYSFLIGPNATGRDSKTFIHGWDFYIKWKPRQNDKGFPFVIFQTEFLLRRYEAAFFINDTGEHIPREYLDDWGMYSQIVVGLFPRVTLGLRYDYSIGDNGMEGRNYLRNERHRVSTAATWYPSEFLKLRLQYNWDDVEHLDDSVSSVWFQCEFLLGKHGAHTF